MGKRKSLRYVVILAMVCLAFHAGMIKEIWAEESTERENTVEEPANTGNTATRSAGFHDTSGRLPDGRYAVEVELSGGSGKASVVSPALMVVENSKYYARITWSSPNYDYMVVSGEKYENQSREGVNSSFLIPILAFDEMVSVTADTLAMGEPHEIPYTLYFYSDSIGPESSLPQEAAKRVLAMAAVIIVVGGVLNHLANKRRKRDYTGGKRQA